jgi:hypothetical protein
MIAIVSVNLRNKNLLRKEIYGDFEKEPETPRKWRQIEIKSPPLESA